jgi:hypothetical protein
LPRRLSQSICALQVRLGRADPPPATLHAAHDLVFAVQPRFGGGQSEPSEAEPTHRVAGGQPVVTVLRDGGLWKLLTLPPPLGGTPDDAWLELVACTVERAWDRWCYAQQHAVRAAQERYKPHVALAVARTAWSNYSERTSKLMKSEPA